MPRLPPVTMITGSVWRPFCGSIHRNCGDQVPETDQVVAR
jgi:hypothetical protein